MNDFIKTSKGVEAELGELMWIPNLGEMETWGIEYEELVQAPGDVVITAFDTIHWVAASVYLLAFCDSTN